MGLIFVYFLGVEVLDTECKQAADNIQFDLKKDGMKDYFIYMNYVVNIDCSWNII